MPPQQGGGGCKGQCQPSKVLWVEISIPNCLLWNCLLTRFKKAIPKQDPLTALELMWKPPNVCIYGVVSRSDISVANYYL